VTAGDEPYVTAWNNLSAVTGSPFSLDLDLPPEPFLGPHDAPLVVLSANPGRDRRDAAAYRRIGVAGRLAEVAMDGGTSFRWLADDVCDTPAGQWWRRCLGALQKEGYSFGELSQCVLNVEFHGYHSVRWSALPVTLPSQWFGFSLVKQAIDRGAVIVLTRAAREWRVAVPDLALYPKLVLAKAAQTASLSSGNLGPEGFSLVTETIKRYRARIE
jgi:hypothetical protein